jgi:hypothetical protein
MWKEWREFYSDVFLFQRQLDQDEIDIIKTIFPESDIKGSTFKISSLIDTVIKTCLEVSIKSNEFIYIDYVNNCGDITGTHLLTLMNILAERLPNIQFILLKDDSKIYICGKVISLSTIKILTKGISWYNSHGYLSINYNEEVKHNSEKINMQYSKFKDEVYELYIAQFKSENSLEKLTLDQQTRKNVIDSVKKKQLESERVSDVDRALLERRIVQYDEFQRQIDNYTTFISDKEKEYKELIDRQIFSDIDINSNNVKDYFNKLLSKMNTYTPSDCKDTTIIEQCDWLSKFISIIEISKILQYDNKLKKIITRETRPKEIGASSVTSGGMATRKKNIKRRYNNQKKYRRRNKTKHYNRKIKRYTKKYHIFKQRTCYANY